MRKNRNKMYIWLMAMAISATIYGCAGANTVASTTEVTTAAETESTKSESSNTSTTDTSSTSGYSKEDLDTSYSDTDTKIELTSGGANITGDGAVYENGNIKITKAGTYVLSGEFDGQIITDVGDNDIVHLVLNGVNITNSTSAAINAATGKKIVITLAEGSTNTLTDASEYVYADGEDEPDGALFVKNDLTINGSGSLTVNANFDTGIKAKDNLIIISGVININSVDKAIKGSDSVTIEDGDITIKAKDDGITTDGAMVINGGNINIEESGEGLEAVTVDINGGNININSTDDGINARGVLDDSATDQEKEDYGMQNQADTYVRFSGGVVNINAQADGIDSNGQVYVEGGEVYISGPTTGGDGSLDYNGEAVITGGTFIAAGSQGMYQSFTNTSTQNYIDVMYSSTVTAGSEIKVTDKNGNVILSFTPDKEYSSILISSDKLVTGETYTISAGDNSQEITVSEGQNTVGEMTGGFGGSGGFGRGDFGGPGGGDFGGSGRPQRGERPTDENGNELERPEFPPSGRGEGAQQTQ